MVPTYFHPSLLHFHDIVDVSSSEGRTILLCLDETNSVVFLSTLSYLDLGANLPVVRLRRGAIAIDLTQQNISGDRFQWEVLQF